MITPSQEAKTEEIRHAYLHYLLDPMVLKYSENLSRAHGLADYAEAAPALPENYKTDYTLLATECLIKAVETRLIPASKREAVVQQALKEGFVMTGAFADGLPGYEKQEQALRLYFPDMVQAFDLRREEKRLAGVEFLKERAVKTTKVTSPPEPPMELTGPEKALEQAESLYRDRKLDTAKERVFAAAREQFGSSRSRPGILWFGPHRRTPARAGSCRKVVPADFGIEA